MTAYGDWDLVIFLAAGMVFGFLVAWLHQTVLELRLIRKGIGIYGELTRKT
jgi:hypothetical protein